LQYWPPSLAPSGLPKSRDSSERRRGQSRTLNLVNGQPTSGALRRAGSLTVVIASSLVVSTCLDTTGPVGNFRVALSPSAASIGRGDTLRFAASVTDQGSPLPGATNVTWTSSSPLVARVDPSGLVTGIALGTTRIRASTRWASTEADLAVMPPTRVIVSPRVAEFLLRDTVRISATVLSARGDTLRDLTVVWATSNPEVASVDSAGLVRGRAFGIAVIRASVRDTSSEALVAVTPIVVTPKSAAVVEGDTTRFHATVVDGNGDTLAAPQVSWSSADTTVATIDPHGVARALKPGAVSIRAAVPNASTASSVTVSLATLVGAGDIGTCTAYADDSTARLLDDIPGIVFTAGDNAYPSGAAESFADCFNASWGRHKARMRPAVGNHDYETADASGYFGYFGAAAGENGKGYYSYDYGAWHIVVINSSIDVATASPQLQWLRSDLAAHPTLCTLAYFHYPLFSSGTYAVPGMRATWDALYAGGADVVISAHDHIYERFAPQTPAGVSDPVRGIREFVVGTGGRSHLPFAGVAPNSEVRDGKTFGVLKLNLHALGYDWVFVPVTGGAFTDSGSGTCH
jgi:uncharacterized protein YjdB